ncbi:unnamed protein product [Haemonchus placei]|uniref:LisH domain-containing protein n=1 Tax=Haemonchus placei TaxID=6290 RepID=A0A0N4X9C5_HAEPC|nr:unnamed protein product [Haemonchus placei]
MDSRIRSAIRQLKNDDSIPAYEKTLFNYVLDYADQMDAAIGRYKELEGEVSNLKCDFAKMVQSSGVDASMLLPTKNVNSDGNLNNVNHSTAVGNTIEKADLSHLIEEKERLRSVVISNMLELSHPSAVSRGIRDGNYLRNVLDFLSIECGPQAFYHLWRPMDGGARLMKVVFPCRFYRDLILKNAPRMRFSNKLGIFIRPSLTKAERAKCSPWINPHLRVNKQHTARNIPNFQSGFGNSSAVSVASVALPPSQVPTQPIYSSPQSTAPPLS